MNRRDLLLLFLLGFAVPFFISLFQSLPGYMDADYYFAGGLQLAKGDGFNEPYLWNYLSDPKGLPTPSHAYWMPLASIVAAAGMWITGHFTYASARIGFILLAALVPPLTSLLAFRLTSNRTSSLLSGLLACFPIYYAPFLPVTDNYAIYMILGISFFLLFSSLLPPNTENRSLITFFCFGLISALASLARSDGLLWLGISFLVAVWFSYQLFYTKPSPFPFSVFSSHFLHFIAFVFRFSFFFLLGYFLLMSPWYARNLNEFGTLMAPGGMRALWLTSYNDTFTFPASQLTFDSWLASGWNAILQARIDAFRNNLLNAFAAQGGIFLFPFILIGLWILRKDVRIRFAALAWCILLFVMTIVFPFAGPRGAFYHAGATLQPIWWSLAPIGLDVIVASARRKGMFDDRAFGIFRGALVGIAILMTLAIFVIRVLPGWEREDGIYIGVSSLLVESGAPIDATVFVRNPPGFYIVSGHPSIAIPNGGLDVILQVSQKFNARYIVIEPASITGVTYDSRLQQYPFLFLGESDGNRLYEILR